jgi:hypothetical protein
MPETRVLPTDAPESGFSVHIITPAETTPPTADPVERAPKAAPEPETDEVPDAAPTFLACVEEALPCETFPIAPDDEPTCNCWVALADPEMAAPPTLDPTWTS